MGEAPSATHDKRRPCAKTSEASYLQQSADEPRKAGNSAAATSEASIPTLTPYSFQPFLPFPFPP